MEGGGGGGGGGWCLNVNLVIGFGPSLGLALWPRAKPIKKKKFTVHHVRLNRDKMGLHKKRSNMVKYIYSFFATIYKQ